MRKLRKKNRKLLKNLNKKSKKNEEINQQEESKKRSGKPNRETEKGDCKNSGEILKEFKSQYILIII